MFATCIVIRIFLALAALLPGNALAQIYRPHEFERYSERRATSRKELERRSGAWKMYGRLGPLSVEQDDGVTLRRTGPKLGRLTFGIRKRF